MSLFIFDGSQLKVEKWTSKQERGLARPRKQLFGSVRFASVRVGSVRIGA